jgi:hypothetical protein
MATKLVVHYKPPPFKPDWMDGCLKLYVVDHPRLGCRLVTTTKVVKEYPKGVYETEYAVYHPIDGDFNDL